MADEEVGPGMQWPPDGCYSLDDPNLPERFAHLRPNAPSVKCSGCGRSTWTEFGEVCDMPQPDGRLCTGRFPSEATRRAPWATDPDAVQAVLVAARQVVADWRGLPNLGGPAKKITVDVFLAHSLANLCVAVDQAEREAQ